MTPKEKYLCRVLARLIDTKFDGEVYQFEEANEVVERFIEVHNEDTPCRYEYECVMTGRCPRDPVCNN